MAVNGMESLVFIATADKSSKMISGVKMSIRSVKYNKTVK